MAIEDDVEPLPVAAVIVEGVVVRVEAPVLERHAAEVVGVGVDVRGPLARVFAPVPIAIGDVGQDAYEEVDRQERLYRRFR